MSWNDKLRPVMQKALSFKNAKGGLLNVLWRIQVCAAGKYGSVYVNAETISELISEMRKLGFRQPIAETDIINWFRKNSNPYVSECLIVRNA